MNVSRFKEQLRLRDRLRFLLSNGRLQFILFITLLSLVFGFAYRNLFHWDMINMGDLGPFHLSLRSLFGDFFYTWSDKNLGEFGSMLPGLFVNEAFWTLLFGGNPGMAQRVFYLSLLPLSGITMYFLLSHFIRSKFGRFVVSTVYALNFVTIPEFMIGGEPLFLNHLLFPLLILFLVNMLEKEKRRMLNLLLFTLILGLASSVNFVSLVYYTPFILALYFGEILSRRNLRFALKTALLLLCSISPFLFWCFLFP